MPSRRVLKGVLTNFLGTYMSRYSDHQGYWLFGFLVAKLESEEFGLLDQNRGGSIEPMDVARVVAARQFAEQVAKSGLDFARVRDARLLIERLPGAVVGTVNGHPCSGFKVRFRATAISDTDRRFESEKIVWVAPHDECVERRSTRATEANFGPGHKPPR